MGQTHALQVIFMNPFRQASKQDMLHSFETHLRLSLKAQANAAERWKPWEQSTGQRTDEDNA